MGADAKREGTTTGPPPLLPLLAVLLLLLSPAALWSFVRAEVSTAGCFDDGGVGVGVVVGGGVDDDDDDSGAVEVRVEGVSAGDLLLLPSLWLLLLLLLVGVEALSTRAVLGGLV